MTKQKAIDLIKKLLALANPSKNPNVAEREAALKKAHEIAAKHGIKIKGPVAPKAPKQPKVKKEQIRRSKIVNPCKAVWRIMKSMPTAARKDILAEAERQGIAKFTATTQYQAHKAMLQVFVKTGVDLGEDEGDE